MECYQWPPPKRVKPLFVAIPSSVLSKEQSLILKTTLASRIARAAAIFRVDKLIIYRASKRGIREYKLMLRLLEYAVTPPHLKRVAIPLRPELKYAGVMEPLRTPAHNPPKELEEGAVLDVYVEGCEKSDCIVNMGKLGRGVLRGSYRRGEIVTAKIVDVESDIPRLVRFEPDYYWNLEVVGVSDRLAPYVYRLKRRGFLIVGTSKLGDCNSGELKSLLKKAKGVLLVVGGPEGHVWDYLPREDFDAIINTIPMQGTLTVRSEEALLASLSVLNSLLPG